MNKRSTVSGVGRDLRPESNTLPIIQIMLALLMGIMIGLGSGWFLFSKRVAGDYDSFGSMDAMNELELQRLIQVAKSMRPEEFQKIFGLGAESTPKKEENTGEVLSTILGLGTLSFLEQGAIEDAKQVLVMRISRFYGMNSPGITGRTVNEETARLLKRIEDAADESPLLKRRLEEERRERNVSNSTSSGSTIRRQERITGGLEPSAPQPGPSAP